MKNYKFVCILNAILLFIIIFFFAYLLLSFLTVIKWLKSLTALAFAISISGGYFLIEYKKNKLAFLKSNEQKQLENLFQKLEIMPDNEVIALLLQVFLGEEINAKVKKNYIETKSANCFYDFSNITNRQTICNAFKLSKNKNVIIFCNKLTDDCQDLIKNNQNKLAVIESAQLFALFKKHGIIEDIPVEKRQQFEFFKKLFLLFKKSFTKRKAVVFMLIGTSLSLLSRFTFFPKYYLISALICFTYAFICLVFGKRKQKRATQSLPVNLL